MKVKLQCKLSQSKQESKTLPSLLLRSVAALRCCVILSSLLLGANVLYSSLWQLWKVRWISGVVTIALAVTTLMIHYSMVSPISAAGCGACSEQKDSVYLTCSEALWLQSSEVCLVAIMSRKERAQMIINHKSKCFPMLAPRVQQLLAARYSGLNLSSPDCFQE